ncbi:class I SAM-dependent methyltransferase [Carboxydochorda subterranea]|uniref:Class I SAM-dependent methyltransferase n=1 Tax=Carboxydichorda subterranea TaxID=3109565 RepID=A0ABZ1BZG4_9FIRM|nr:class I SAM-dependent methyltransferase [Limnochorda sp. L945t]WRP18089.1 class I SAM-dependent methyltransferase [Limnochorda sp. L945t]
MLVRRSRGADYGIDAPYVVRNLTAMGVGLFVLALAALSLRGALRPVGQAVGRALLASFAIGVVEGAYMVWSSKVGKLMESGNSPQATWANARAEGVAGRIQLVTGDVRRLPFRDEKFDAVVSSLVLHNLGGAEERRRALGQIMQALKPGGRFAILDFQHVKEYAKVLRELGALDVHVTGLRFLMFPPVRVVAGRKPAQACTRPLP